MQASTKRRPEDQPGWDANPGRPKVPPQEYTAYTLIRHGSVRVFVLLELSGLGKRKRLHTHKSLHGSVWLFSYNNAAATRYELELFLV